MNNDDTKQEGLSIPVYTKPITKGEEVDEASIPAPVQQQPVQPTISESEPVIPMVEPEPNTAVVEQPTVNNNAAPAQPVNQSQPVQEQQSMYKSEFDRYANNLNGGLDRESRNNLINQDEDGDKHLKAFIGKNYDKFVMGKFNFGFFFFGPLYLFYRKMIGKGIAFILIVNAIGLLAGYFVKIPDMPTATYAIPLVINGICQFIYCFKVSGTYYSYATSKTKDIEINMMNEPDEIITKTCQRKGGKSILHVILGLFCTSLIGALMAFVLMLLMIFGVVKTIGYGDFQFSLGKNDEPVESIYTEDLDINNYKYNLPERFSITSGNKNIMFTNSSDGAVCSVNINKLKKETTAENYIEELKTTCGDKYKPTPDGSTEECYDVAQIEGELKWIGFKSEEGYGYYSNLKDGTYFAAVSGYGNQKCASDIETLLRSFNNAN